MNETEYNEELHCTASIKDNSENCDVAAGFTENTRHTSTDCKY